jgi:hypothetical protein
MSNPELIDAESLANLREVVARAERAADNDYNDVEIDALRVALDTCLEILSDLGIDVTSKTYKIVRFYQSDDWDTEVIKTGLTLEQAQAYCSDPETSSSTATGAAEVARTEKVGPWFCGYTDESR